MLPKKVMIIRTSRDPSHLISPGVLSSSYRLLSSTTILFFNLQFLNRVSRVQISKPWTIILKTVGEHT